MSNEVNALAARVRSGEQLAELIHALLLEFRTEGHTWENVDLSRYLQALAAVAQDRSTDGPPTWRHFAELLVAASVYE